MTKPSELSTRSLVSKLITNSVLAMAFIWIGIWGLAVTSVWITVFTFILALLLDYWSYEQAVELAARVDAKCEK